MAGSDAARARRRSARRAALRVIAALGINDVSIVRDHLEEICIARGAMPTYRHLRGSEGQILRRADGRVLLVIDAQLRRCRRRFSLGHELGHHEQHDGIDRLQVCTARDMRDYRADPREIEANQFSAYLLMPPGLFDPLAEALPPSLPAVRSLAARFDTSLTATARRLVACSEHPCAVLACSARGIRWAITSEGFDARLDRSPRALSTRSRAHRALVGGEALGEAPAEVDPDVWLDQPDGRWAVHESSLALRGLGECLTLLWLVG